MAFLDKTGLEHLWAHIITKLGDKVDKVSGKGLSTNDYTTEEKNKLAGIADGAEVNVNADWNATSGDAKILNKPTIPSKTSQLTNDSGFITSSDIPEGPVASTTTPKMNGTASVGTETAFARGDHVHPSDTTKAGLASNNIFSGTNTFKGKVTISTAPAADTDAANKAYVDEKSKTAEKLATPRNIRIGDNAIGTAVPFDGSKDINIPISGLYNTALIWSNSGDTAGSVTPIGTAIIPNFNANRIAFLPDDAIEVEYSTDGGNTWTNCETHKNNIDLTTLFNKTDTSYSIGNKSAIGAKASINDKLRITFTAYRDNHTFVYCNIRKIFIKVTTNGAIGSKVLIEKANIGTPNTFTTVKESRLEGWTAWNEINTTLLFGGGDYAPTQAKKLRFTFSITGLDETYSSALAVSGMYFMGENCWASSSTLAEAGHMYEIGADKSCTFPGNVKIDTSKGNFIGNLQGNADKAINDASGNNIENTYLKKNDTNTFLKTITGYDESKTQILSHDANGNMAWINSIDTLLV